MCIARFVSGRMARSQKGDASAIKAFIEKHLHWIQHSTKPILIVTSGSRHTISLPCFDSGMKFITRKYLITNLTLFSFSFPRHCSFDSEISNETIHRRIQIEYRSAVQTNRVLRLWSIGCGNSRYISGKWRFSHWTNPVGRCLSHRLQHNRSQQLRICIPFTGRT